MIMLEDVSITVGTFSLRHLSYTMPTGSYCVLMGRSGVGKTTLLEAICGLNVVTSGRIFIMGREVTQVPPAQRGIGFVPQEGALFPTMTVYEHLAFPLRLRRWTREQIRQRVESLAAQLEISALLSRYPAGLSGGERQRVALGRALSASPQVLCLDEPLSALDTASHARLCVLLRAVHQDTGITVLHVTHNPREAEHLATCVYTLEPCPDDRAAAQPELAVKGHEMPLPSFR